MADGSKRNDTSGKLEMVRALLETGLRLVEELASGTTDLLLERWQRAYHRMPEQDRETVVGVLEREVELRNVARSSRDSVSGFEISRPNPNARIYVRVFGETPTYFSRDDVMRATLRAARVILISPPPHADWQEATLDAFRLLAPAERAALAKHNREMLELIARVETKSAQSA